MAAARSISAETLVVLPRLSGLPAARLIRELLSAAKAEKKLPPFIIPIATSSPSSSKRSTWSWPSG